MAGYTSRFFLTLTIPLFGFSLIWFLKRKIGPSRPKSHSKAVQVETLAESNNQFLKLDSMKLKNKDESCESTSEMQLKETQAPLSPVANGVQHNGTAKEMKKMLKAKQSCESTGEMQLKETQAYQPPMANGVQHSGAAKEMKKMLKSKQSCESTGEMQLKETQARQSPIGNGVQHNGTSKEMKRMLKSKLSCESLGEMQLKVTQARQPPIGNGVQLNGTTKEMKKMKSKQSCESTSEVRLKETQVPQSPIANGVQHNDTAKEMKKIFKSKLREKDCSLPKDYIPCDSSTFSIEEDNGIELANGIEMLKLNGVDLNATKTKDELKQNNINKTLRDMELTDNTNSSPINVHFSEDAEKHVSETDDVIHQNGTTETSTEELVSSSTYENEKTSISPNIQTLLTLPVDLAEASTSSTMLDSSYCQSLGSPDSGRGASEHQFDIQPEYQVRSACDEHPNIPEGAARAPRRNPIDPNETDPVTVSYEFEILKEYTGYLIGKQGKNIKNIKSATNADVWVYNHSYSESMQICSIKGTEDEIHAALKIIRQKFPTELYPTVTLSPMALAPVIELPDPELLRLNLPEGVTFDVMLSATMSPDHFFLQQPTHPTFHSLPILCNQMTTLYNTETAPPMTLIDRGHICAVNIGEAWYRCEIMDVFEESDECRIKFLDYGGYVILPSRFLKQIRADFLHMIPFQATECFLADVLLPEGATEWSQEATAAFECLAQGQILQGYIVAYSENGIPFVKLLKYTGTETIDINEEFIRQGFARSMMAIQTAISNDQDHQQQCTSSSSSTTTTTPPSAT